MKYIVLLLLLLPFVSADALKQTVSGSQVQKNVKRVMKVYQWENSLENLKEQAQSSNKMIFWLQIVGELEGGL